MKAIKFIVILITISLISCQKDFDRENEVERLETLKISSESLEFLEYYEKTETLIFKRENKNDELIIVDHIKGEPINRKNDLLNDSEYWVFTKAGNMITEYDERSSTRDNLAVVGKTELKKIRYIDSANNTLEFTLRNNSSVLWNERSWKGGYEYFSVRYSNPCWTTYLKYKTKIYNEKLRGDKYEAVMHDDFEVRQKKYTDVMELKTANDEAHFKMLASKGSGLIYIADQDNDVNWVLVD